jgi:hypothetical protein
MSKEETYQRTLVLAIRTIDDLFYGKYQRDISKLRRVLDCVLNYNLNYQEACESADKEIAVTEKIQQKLKANKDGAVQLELQF